MRLATLVLLAVLTGSLCAPVHGAPVRGGTLNIAIDADPPSLDPHKTPSSGIPHYLLYIG